jgi:hypothetical protein
MTEKENSELLYDIVMSLGEIRKNPPGECTTLGTIKALVERWNRSEMALKELENIRTEAVACRGCGPGEATSISRARVLLRVPFSSWDNVNHPS